MEVSAKYIAEQLGGEVVGNPDAAASSVARIESGKPGTLCFLANPKYEHYIYTCDASIILINKSFEPKKEIRATLVRVDDAYQAIAVVLGIFDSMNASRPRGRALSAHIAWSARRGKRTYVGANAYIGRKSRIGDDTLVYPQVYIGNRVTIGKDCIIYPGVRIYDGCKIGDRCIIHANAVIGSDGFGFAPTEDGSYKKIPQTGIVTIEDDVEIGANTVIDRSTMGTTLIEKGVKLDNLIQIAHNVVIGSNTVIAAQSGIAGSTHIGKNCMLGGQVGIAGHLTVADRTNFAAQSGLLSNVKEEGATMMGYPAIPYREYIRAYAIFRKNAKN